MIAGIVLAGGASSRMGQPKALLRLGTETMAERLVRLFRLYFERVALVTGAHHNEISQALPELDASIAFNPLHASGMFSSLRCGLMQFPEADAVLFSPVDFATIEASTIAVLLAHAPNAIVKPRWQGQSGHPVLIRRPAIEALLAAGPQSNAKEILSHLPATYIDVDDPGVAQDCDTPADYERILKGWRA